MKKRRLLLPLLLSLGVLTGCGSPTYIEVTALELNRNSANLNIGESMQLRATAITNPVSAPAPEITFWSSDETIASVSSSGLVTALKGGDVSIMAIAGSKNAICSLYVSEPDKPEVSYRQANLEATFDAPYFTLENIGFSAPVYFYKEQRKNDTNYDAFVAYGQKSAKARDNFTIVKALAEHTLSGATPVLEEFDVLAEEIAKDPTKAPELLKNEKAHLTFLDSAPYFAFTTKEGDKEKARYTKAFDGDAVDLLSFATFLPTIISSMSGLNLSNLISKLSGKITGIDISSDMIRDLLSILLTGFSIKSETPETGGSIYRLEATEDGVKKISDFLLDYKKRIGLKDEVTVTKLSLNVAFLPDGGGFSHFGFDLGFDCKQTQNEISGSIGSFTKSETAPEDTFDAIRDLYKNA